MRRGRIAVSSLIEADFVRRVTASAPATSPRPAWGRWSGRSSWRQASRSRTRTSNLQLQVSVSVTGRQGLWFYKGFYFISFWYGSNFWYSRELFMIRFNFPDNAPYSEPNLERNAEYLTESLYQQKQNNDGTFHFFIIMLYSLNFSDPEWNTPFIHKTT